MLPHKGAIYEYTPRDPSSDADFVRATFSHKGRRRRPRLSRMMPLGSSLVIIW